MQHIQPLAFLSSSDLSLDILRAHDETIGFEDTLNDLSKSELMGEPHLMVDYKLGLLSPVVLFMKREGLRLVYSHPFSMI